MKSIKDVITDKEMRKLNDADVQKVLNDYEYVSQIKPFRVTYIKKEVYYSDPDDIVIDKDCDLSFLEGATIKKIGFHKKAQEGGLALVYKKDGKEKIAVLGFTELGMWVYANVDKR